MRSGWFLWLIPAQKQLKVPKIPEIQSYSTYLSRSPYRYKGFYSVFFPILDPHGNQGCHYPDVVRDNTP